MFAPVGSFTTPQAEARGDGIHVYPAHAANRARVWLTGASRGDFWARRPVALAAPVVPGVGLPPLSTVDRTVDVESSLCSNWAQVQQRLTSHPGAVRTGPGGSGTTGFSAAG